MSKKSKHDWYFEEFDPASEWIFNTPTAFSESLGFCILEIGYFIIHGYNYTNRVPEQSFCLNFRPRNFLGNDTASFQEAYFFIRDNRNGYIEEGFSDGTPIYFIQFHGILAETYANFFLQSSQVYRFESPQNVSFFLDIFQKLLNLYKQPYTEKRELYGSLLVYQLLTQLFIGKNSITSTSLYTENEHVKLVLEIIASRYTEDLKLNTVAEELHVNYSYLSRIIKEETGHSFSTHLIHTRINNAKKLLITSNYSIDEISYQCGFFSASHFIRLFHQYENTTPKQFRLMHKTDIS